VSTLSTNTSKHQATSAPGARVDRAGDGRPAGAARAQPRPAPRSSEAGDVDIRRLLQRLGRRWSIGASPERRGAIEAVRPYLGKLKEAERAVTSVSLDARLATGRATALEASVAKHLRRRDDLVQQVLHSRHEAASQRSSSRGAALRRTSSEWAQELRAYDAKFGERPNELATAKSEAYEKQAELRLLKKQVTQLEAAIDQFLSSFTRPDDGGGGADSGKRERTAGGGNHPPEGIHPSTRPPDPGSVARVRTEQAAGRTPDRRANGRQVRQIGPPARTSRGGITRELRR